MLDIKKIKKITQESLPKLPVLEQEKFLRIAESVIEVAAANGESNCYITVSQVKYPATTIPFIVNELKDFNPNFSNERIRFSW